MKAFLLLVAACGSGASAKPEQKPDAPKPAPKPEQKPAPKPGTGTVTVEHFHSNALGVDKDVVVYLPVGYDPKGKKHYPVFYYLHGVGGDEYSWTKNMALDQAADALKLQAIVVMPDGDGNWYVDSKLAEDYDACIKDGTGLLDADWVPAKTCVKKSSYETYLTREVIAWVDRTYLTLAVREGRAIAGFSMGGFGALMLAMRHQDLFSAAASHSGVDSILYKGPYPYVKDKVELYADTTDLSQWQGKLGKWGDWIRDMFSADIANWKAHDPVVLAERLEPGKLAIYLDCGTEDKYLLQAGMQYLHDRLLAKGIAHAYYLGPGGHTLTFWKERVPHSLEWLAAQVIKAR